MALDQARHGQLKKPVNANPRPPAFTHDVCLEIFRHLHHLQDKMAFSSACHSALQANKDGRAWKTCDVTDFSILHGKTFPAPLALCMAT